MKLLLLLSAQKFSIVKLKIFSIMVGLLNSPLLFWPVLQLSSSLLPCSNDQTKVACAMLRLNIDPEIGAKSNSRKMKRPVRKSEICANPLIVIPMTTLLLKISLTTPKLFYNNFPNVFFRDVCLSCSERTIGAESAR
jgi:hypothetical protein